MIQTVRGTRDILPEDTPVWQHVEEVAKETFRRYGFREIRTPIIEKTELFVRGVGEATDIVHKEMYTFTDRNEDSIVLRPEATASVVRAYLQHKLYADRAPGEVTKSYYIGPMFRRERPQAGRYRQFYQIGAEVIGSSDNPLIEAEVIELLDHFLKELGIVDRQLLINSIGDVAERGPYLETLRAAIGNKLDRLCSDCHHRYETNALRVFDCKVEACQSVIAELPTILDSIGPESRSHFEKFRSYLDERQITYTINPRMVRGLDYYARTTFEIIGGSLGAQNTLVGGGRYDGLSELIGGPPMKGFGFALGLDRMVLSLTEAEVARARTNARPDIFIVHFGETSRDHSVGLARSLRAAGLAIELDFADRKMKKSMAMASASGARYALIVGENEIATEQYGLKNLATGEQSSLALTMIIQTVKETK